MGQKVSPVGLRIGINKDWESKWYAKNKDFSKMLNTDIKIRKYLDNLDCILVDEAQFLSRNQIDELFYITKIYDIPVIAYGLKTNFKSVVFTGSSRLVEVADSLEEIPTICKCGKKARFNVRTLNGEYLKEGDDILIDGTTEIKYESLCGKCYVTKVLGITKL